MDLVSTVLALNRVVQDTSIEPVLISERDGKVLIIIIGMWELNELIDFLLVESWARSDH